MVFEYTRTRVLVRVAVTLQRPEGGHVAVKLERGPRGGATDAAAVWHPRLRARTALQHSRRRQSGSASASGTAGTPAQLYAHCSRAIGTLYAHSDRTLF